MAADVKIELDVSDFLRSIDTKLPEHPEYAFQKGRKGKYLEDPIKENLKPLGEHYVSTVQEALK